MQRHPTKCFWYCRLRTFDAFALERKATSAAGGGGFGLEIISCSTMVWIN